MFIRFSPKAAALRPRAPLSAFASIRLTSFLVAIGATALFAGCALSPAGLAGERGKLAAAGQDYETPAAARTLPDLPAQPEWRDILRRALLANGDLEASFFEWKGALSRVDIASAYPNTNLSLGFSYLFSPEKMKTFDRASFTAGPDAMKNLVFPSKARRAAQAALDEAQAAGERFRARKFEIQRQALTSWADYTLLAEQLRIQQEDLALVKGVYETAASRVGAGGQQQDLLRAEIDLRKSEDALRNLEAGSNAERARLNGMLARDPAAELAAPAKLPEPRPLPLDNAGLIAAAIDQNPELAGLADETEGRRDALELARLQWIPDINPTFSATGAASQALGMMIVLPTTLPAIRGSIAEAESQLRSSEATLRQAQQDRAAAFVAALVSVRNSERQSALFGDWIEPLARKLVTTIQQSYSAGSASYGDAIEARRTLLEVRLTIADAKASREKGVAEMEALMGTDLETLTNAKAQGDATSGALKTGNERP